MILTCILINAVYNMRSKDGDDDRHSEEYNNILLLNYIALN